jgi:ribonuclease HIII
MTAEQTLMKTDESGNGDVLGMAFFAVCLCHSQGKLLQKVKTKEIVASSSFLLH